MPMSMIQSLPATAGRLPRVLFAEAAYASPHSRRAPDDGVACGTPTGDTGKRVPFVSTWHRATPARPGPPKKSVPPTPTPPSSPSWRRWLLPAGTAIAFTALLVFLAGTGGTPAQALNYTGFVSDVTANKVSTAAITSAGSV